MVMNISSTVPTLCMVALLLKVRMDRRVFADRSLDSFCMFCVHLFEPSMPIAVGIQAE